MTHLSPADLLAHIYGLFPTSEVSLCPAWRRDEDEYALRFSYDPRCGEGGGRLSASPRGSVVRHHREGLTLRGRALDAELATLEEGEVLRAAWSPDEGLLAALARPRGARRALNTLDLLVWDLRLLDPLTDEPPRLLLSRAALPPEEAAALPEGLPLCFSRDGRRLVTGQWARGALHVTRFTLGGEAPTPPRESLGALPRGARPRWLHGADERVAVVALLEGALRLWVLPAAPPPLGAAPLGDAPAAPLAVTLAGERCACLPSGDVLCVVEGEGGAPHLALLAPPRRAWDSFGAPHTLAALPPGGPYPLLVHPEDSWVAVVAGEGAARVLLCYLLMAGEGGEARAELIGRTPLAEPVSELTLDERPYSLVASGAGGAARMWLGLLES